MLQIKTSTRKPTAQLIRTISVHPHYFASIISLVLTQSGPVVSFIAFEPYQHRQRRQGKDAPLHLFSPSSYCPTVHYHSPQLAPPMGIFLVCIKFLSPRLVVAHHCPCLLSLVDFIRRVSLLSASRLSHKTSREPFVLGLRSSQRLGNNHKLVGFLPAKRSSRSLYESPSSTHAALSGQVLDL